MTEIRIYQSLRKNMLWAILCFVFALGGYFILTDASTSWPTKVLGGGLGIIFFGGGGLFLILSTVYNRIRQIPHKSNGGECNRLITNKKQNI